MPKRIQRKRTKDWKMPDNAVYVGRPSRWGNDNKVGDPYPFTEGHPCTLEDVIWLYEVDMRTMDTIGGLDAFLAPLRGKDLACWCPLDQPCHADVLLKLANREQEIIDSIVRNQQAIQTVMDAEKAKAAK
jgi:hypothetical protein